MSRPGSEHLKVALYARVSTTDQNTDNQMLRLEEFAAQRYYGVYERYTDKVSGANKNRPALDRMMVHAKARRFDRILATKIDRLGRSAIHLYELFTTVETYGVSIETIDQPIDTSTPSGRFTVLVLSGVAELERELIRERTKDGLRRTVANGTKLGRKERTLSDYQRNKIKKIVANDPGISYRKLARQFEGISRTKLIELAKAEGLIQ